MDKNLRIQASADYIATNPIFKKCMYVVTHGPKILKDVPKLLTVVINVIMWEKWENVIMEVSLGPIFLI